jgi:hypothetical protein
MSKNSTINHVKKINESKNLAKVKTLKNKKDSRIIVESIGPWDRHRPTPEESPLLYRKYMVCRVHILNRDTVQSLFRIQILHLFEDSSLADLNYKIREEFLLPHQWTGFDLETQFHIQRFKVSLNSDYPKMNYMPFNKNAKIIREDEDLGLFEIPKNEKKWQLILHFLPEGYSFYVEFLGIYRYFIPAIYKLEEARFDKKYLMKFREYTIPLNTKEIESESVRGFNY